VNIQLYNSMDCDNYWFICVG